MAWVSTAAGVGTAIFSGLRSAKQKREADKLARQNQFPEQQVPDAVKEAEQMAQNNAQFGLGATQYQQGQRTIARNAATAMGGARDRGSALQAIPYIQQQSNDAGLNLDVADNNARMNKQGQLMNQKNLVGQYQNNAWDWNKRQKYIQQAAAVRGLLGASRENMNTALDRGLGAAVGFAGSRMQANNNNWGGNPSSNSGAPTYANGYGANDNYSEFQTETY